MNYGRTTKTIASLLLILLLHEIVLPIWLPLYATTQPESFGSSGSSEYVDPFTGQFKYSIPVITVPGPNGSDYTLDLSYNSGIKPEEEASWVGWGWNLSPGSITRMKNGLPDDVKDVEIKQFNKTEPLNIVSAKLRAGGEIFENKLLSGSAGLTAIHNSLTGWTTALELGGGWSFLSGNLSISNTGIGFSSGISWSRLISDAMNGFSSIEAAKRLPFTTSAFDPSLSFSFPYTNSRLVSTSAIEYEGYDGNWSKNYSYDLDENTEVWGLAGIWTSYAGSVSDIVTTPIVTHQGSGYLFAGQQRINSSKKGEMMDYIHDKEYPFAIGNKAHPHYAIPRHGADVFIASGKGPKGTFRAYHNKAITFAPRTVVNSIPRVRVHGSIILGNSTGAGFGLGGVIAIPGTKYNGTKKYSGYAEPTIERNSEFSAARDEVQGGFEQPGYCQSDWFKDNPGRYVFRFMNDPGQPLKYAYHNSEIDGGYVPIVNGNGSMESASMIAYRTKQDFSTSSMSSGSRRRVLSYASYSPFSDGDIGKEDNGNLLSNVKPSNKESIDEFALFDNGGTRYVYSYPVYGKNEHSLRFAYTRSDLLHGSIVGGRITYDSKSIYNNNGQLKSEKDLPYVSGQKLSAQYAVSYMPTQILSSDYVDIDDDGPDADDAGTYVLFRYRNKGFVKWRFPHRGFYYDAGISEDKLTSSASVSYGEREQIYLSTIKTKTHIAYFITNKTQTSVEGSDGTIQIKGSNIDRKDAIPAPNDEAVAGVNGFVPSTNNPKEILERIELYQLDNSGKPQTKIKTVYFAYSYELMKGCKDASSQNGRLTLKNVWEENLNISEAKISKYSFVYAYPTAPSNTPTLNSYTSLFTQNYTSVEQNPDYSEGKVDAWGNYQFDDTRMSALQYWNEQNLSEDFDPAAWHLKKIITPTRGEILVQYEQNDYSYVQDKRSMVMTKVLQEWEISNGLFIPNDFKYRITVPSNKREKILSYLKERYVTNKERLYFRFKYRLPGDEYRTFNGYTIVHSVDAYSSNNTDIIFEIKDDYAPKVAAEDFYHEYGGYHFGIGEPAFRLATWFAGMILTAIQNFDMLFSSSPSLYHVSGAPEYAYFKLPLLGDKKGGGIRVKRLLTVSQKQSLENNSSDVPIIYGQEYVYKCFDDKSLSHISSGVATNEPGAIQFECSLTDILPTTPGYFNDKLIFGADKESSEGPIYSGFLPSPSIGYSNVYIKNINSGPSGGGYMRYTYQTVKEFPTVNFEYTRYSLLGDMPSVGTGKVVEIMENFGTVNTIKGSGKYTLRISNRHGLPWTITNYAGTLQLEEDKPHEGEQISHTLYEYFSDSESKPVMHSLSAPIRHEYLGRITEYWSENRLTDEQHYFSYGDASFAMNNIPPPGNVPPFFVAANASCDYSREVLSMRVNVVSESNIPFLKRIVTTRDNMRMITSNIAFDPSDGKPLMTKTTGDHSTISQIHHTNSGSYYTYNLAAYKDYTSLSSKTTNENTVLISGNNDALIGNNSMNIASGNLDITLFGGVSDKGLGYTLKKKLIKGDIVEVFNSNTALTGTLYKITNSPVITPSGSDELYSYTITPATGSGTISGLVTKIIVRKSGYENKTSLPSGSITLYNADAIMNTVLDYADKLKVRDESAERINERVLLAVPKTGTQSAGYNPNVSYEYEEGINKEQGFTCLHTGGTLDYISTNNVIYNGSTDGGVKFKGKLENTSLRIGFWNGTDWTFPYANVAWPYAHGKLVSVSDKGKFVLSAKKYGEDYEMSRIFPRCGKRISATEDCYSPTEIDISSQKKNAYPTDAYSFVLSATKIEYSDQYTLIPERLGSSITTAIGQIPKPLRPCKTYVLRSTALSGAPGVNYDYGTQTYSDFNPSSIRWLLTSVIESYNEIGSPVSVKDVHGQFATTRYGLNGVLPLCTGTYARAFREPGYSNNDNYFHDIYYQSFESYSPLVKTGGAVISTTAHTGSQCLSIPANGTSVIKHNVTPYNYETDIRNYEVSFWASSPSIGYTTQLPISLGNINLVNSSISPEAKVVKIDNEGRLWFLYKISGTNINALFTSNGELSIGNNSSTTALYIDDLKVRPIESAVICHVYDPKTLQSVAVFDDNHYASTIQYDMRGIAVRGLQETSAGWKTVSEQTMNIPKSPVP